MNNNNQRGLSILDIITMISFIAQIQNMKEDDEQTSWIHEVILALSNEVEKLHKENDIIMNKLDTILSKMK